MALLFVYLSDLSRSDIINSAAWVGAAARLHACLYTISSSAWRIFRVIHAGLIIGGELRPSILTRSSLLATPDVCFARGISANFYRSLQFVPTVPFSEFNPIIQLSH